jgi:hypothetical protein
MKHLLRAFPMALALILTVLVGGCGTARVDLKTDVISPTDVSQELLITADGAFGESLKQSFDPNKMRQDGWTTDLKSQGNGYVLRMNKKLSGSGNWLPASAGDTASATSGTNFDFKVNEGLLDREYNLHIVLPPNQLATSAPKTDAERQGQQLGEQLIRSAFKLSWAVNLPGELIETNADSRTKNGGTWEIGYDGLTKGVDMRISSRERKDLTPFIGGGVVVLGMVGFGVAWRRRQASSHKPKPQLSEPQ